MNPSNSIFSTAHILAVTSKQSTLVVIIHRDDPMCTNTTPLPADLANLPTQAATIAWDKGISMTHISDDERIALTDYMLHAPDFFPADTTLRVKVGVFFHEDTLNTPDDVIALYFDQETRTTKTIRYIDVHPREEQNA